MSWLVAHGQTLPFKCIQKLPDSYSEFLKSVEPLRSQPRKTLPSPTTLPPLPPAEAFPPLRVEYTIPNDRESFLETMLQPIDVQFQAFTRIDTRSIRDGLDHFTTNNSFQGGESNGLERLFHFIQSGATSSYDKARTAPMGHEFSTKLSAYLAIGCITARQIHEAMRYYEDGMAADAPHYEQQTLLQRFRDAPGFGRGENEGTKSLRQMLLWRDYFHLLARKLGTHLFALYGSSGRHTIRDGGDKKADQHEWRQISSLPNSVERCESRRIFERFVVGRTGMSFIDASQRELLLTGYTANRARQNVAYFLAKLMRLDWRLGAEWYECTLVDYDPASNWGNWQYAAGVGNDPREGRIFNPVKQAFDYDSNGEYIKKWIPELRDLKMLDAQENGDKQMLLKLYQPCNLGLDEKIAMSLEGADFVEDPLVKIEFRIDGKPRRNNQGGRGQGRGGSTGRSWRDTVADSANGPERGGRGRGRGRGTRGSKEGRGKYNAIERSNAREGSDEGKTGNVENDWEREEETRVAKTTGAVVANAGAQQQEVESSGVRRTELVIRSMASRPLSAGF